MSEWYLLSPRMLLFFSLSGKTQSETFNLKDLSEHTNGLVMLHITVKLPGCLLASLQLKTISVPDKETVLFLLVTKPSSKRRAESPHQALVMAMKWTGALVHWSYQYATWVPLLAPLLAMHCAPSLPFVNIKTCPQAKSKGNLLFISVYGDMM